MLASDNVNLLEESLWVLKEFKRQRVGLEMCQCGTEKIISKSVDPFRMRASLLSLVFAKQLITDNYPEVHSDFVREFKLPSLKHHISHEQTSPVWFLHNKEFNHPSLDLFKGNFQGCMRSLTMWLREKLGRYVPELHSIINNKSLKEFGSLSGNYFLDRSGTKAINIRVDDFYPEYLDTHFQLPNEDIKSNSEVLFTDLLENRRDFLLNSFAIISAYATTGQKWSEEENHKADKCLHDSLSLIDLQPFRINAFSPKTNHTEPSWCVELSWNSACDLGMKYKQEAIYFVENDVLHLSFCDQRRVLVPIGKFSERISLN